MYKIRKLIKGYIISPSLKDKVLIAVPFATNGVVQYNGKTMKITDHTNLLHSQTFDDKFVQGKRYTLYYYEWKENNNQTTLAL
jgi:hypothetical protein